MTERDAIYQAVLEAPFDNAPRLVLADWMDEHGQDGADLRRRVSSRRVQQCHVTGFPGLAFHGARGFPFRVTTPMLATFLPLAERLFRTWPITDVMIPWSRPYRNDDYPEGRRTKGAPAHWWLWERYHRDDAEGAIGADDIPRPVFRFLGGKLVERDWFRAFPTRRAADLALRRALVRYGRDLAGLPTLAWSEAVV